MGLYVALVAPEIGLKLDDPPSIGALYHWYVAELNVPPTSLASKSWYSVHTIPALAKDTFTFGGFNSVTLTPPVAGLVQPDVSHWPREA